MLTGIIAIMLSMLAWLCCRSVPAVSDALTGFHRAARNYRHAPYRGDGGSASRTSTVRVIKAREEDHPAV